MTYGHRGNRNTVTFIEDTCIMRIFYNLGYYQNEYLTLMFGICGYYVCAPFQLSGVIFPIICVIIHATFSMPNVQIMDRGNFYQQFLRQTPMDYFLEEIGLKPKFRFIASDPARQWNNGKSVSSFKFQIHEFCQYVGGKVIYLQIYDHLYHYFFKISNKTTNSMMIWKSFYRFLWFSLLLYNSLPI